MFANKKTSETAGQSVAEGIALVKAMGASVQDSVLKIEQVNKGFVKALSGVKAADALFCAQTDYVRGFGQVTQDTVLDLTNLTHQAMTRYLDRVSAQLSASSSVAKSAPAEEPEVAVVAEPATPVEEPEAAVVAETAAPAEEPEAAVVAETAAPAEEPEAAAVAEPAAPAEEPEVAAVAEPAVPAEEPEVAVVAEPAVPAEEPEVAVVAEPAVPAEEPEVAAVAEPAAPAQEPEAVVAAQAAETVEAATVEAKPEAPVKKAAAKPRRTTRTTAKRGRSR